MNTSSYYKTKHKDLFKLYGTSSYCDIVMEEKHHLESSFLCVCLSSGLPSLFRFVVTHIHKQTRYNSATIS